MPALWAFSVSREVAVSHATADAVQTVPGVSWD
jgi:hypothetical protein